MSRKEELIEKIASIEDPQMIEELDRWISSIIEAASAEQYTQQELDAVREGFSQYKSDETFTREEANKIFDEWLKGK